MITLVTGGSGSGKSAYAESLLYSCEGIRYYIATMQIYDAEGEKKVERHRKLRAGKGFLTIESPINVGKIQFACAGKAEQAQYRPVCSMVRVVALPSVSVMVRVMVFLTLGISPNTRNSCSVEAMSLLDTVVV